MQKRKQPSDANQLAHSILQQATGAPTHEELRSHAAKILGRMGGLKGGPARHKALTAQERKQIATDAAKARWAKKRKPRNS